VNLLKTEQNKRHTGASFRVIDFGIIFFALLSKYLDQVVPDNTIPSYMAIGAMAFLVIVKIAWILYKHGFTSNKATSGKSIQNGLFVLLVVGYTLCMHKTDLLFAFMMAYALWDLGISRYINYWGISSGLIYSTNLILFQLGVITDHHYMARTLDSGTYYRASIGLNHPNYSIPFLLPLICAGIYTRGRIRKTCIIILCTFLTYETYLLTDSRTALLSAGFGIVLAVLSFFIKKWALTSKLAIISPFFVTVLSLLVAVKGKSSVSLNELLSSRPFYWSEAIRHIRLLGPDQFIKDLYEAGGSVDNFSIYLLSSYGIIVAIPILLLISMIAVVSSRKQSGSLAITNPELCLIIIVYMAYGFSERHVLDFGFGLLAPLMFLAVLNPAFFTRGSKLFTKDITQIDLSTVG
jgi:hypothetical protein